MIVLVKEAIENPGQVSGKPSGEVLNSLENQEVVHPRRRNHEPVPVSAVVPPRRQPHEEENTSIDAHSPIPVRTCSKAVCRVPMREPTS